MTDQIQANLSLNVESTGYSVNPSWNFTDLLASQFLCAGIQTATTTFAAMTLGDMVTSDCGVLVLKNLDTNNYINYGSTQGEWKLDPGEFAFARMTPGTSIYLRANTANVKVEKYLLGK